LFIEELLQYSGVGKQGIVRESASAQFFKLKANRMLEQEEITEIQTTMKVLGFTAMLRKKDMENQLKFNGTEIDSAQFLNLGILAIDYDLKIIVKRSGAGITIILNR
jgi:hypothetical protein